MDKIRGLKVLLFVGIMIFIASSGSLSFAQITDTGNNVGIGLDVPATKLHVRNTSGSTVIRVESVDSGSFQAVQMGDGIGGPNASAVSEVINGNSPLISRRFNFELFNQSTNGSITFHTANEGTPKMVINSLGNVGIGTTSPTAKLQVAGDAIVDGNIAAKYQDVAEWVPAKAALKPGTVVVIDPKEHNQVLPASQAYDTRIAGVVSAQPGILLGEAGEDKVKVAHSGRVKVKADAQYGVIAVGDLLVSSATSGYAMRSTPVDVNGVGMHRPGTIVGKALEPLKEGKGEILVLLTLQ